MDPKPIDERLIISPYYQTGTGQPPKKERHSADNKRNLTVIAKYPGDGLFYLVTNGEVISQSVRHVFVFNQSRTRDIADYHYVLAPVQSELDSVVYLPAKVTDSEPPGKIMLEICDKTRTTIHLSDCFYINNDYYINAINFYNSHKHKTAVHVRDHPLVDQNDFGEDTEKENLNTAYKAVLIEAERFQNSSFRLNSSQKLNRTPEIAAGLRTDPLMQNRRWGTSFRKDGSLKLPGTYGINRHTQVNESMVEIKITCVRSRRSIDIKQDDLNQDDKDESSNPEN